MGGRKIELSSSVRTHLTLRFGEVPQTKHSQTGRRISIVVLGVSHWLGGKPKRTQLEYPGMLFAPYILQASLATCGNCSCAMLCPCGKYATYDVMHAVNDIVLLPCGYHV